MAIVSMYGIRMPRRPQPSTVGSLVWRLSMKWRATVDRAVAPLGLTHAQYVLLASLYGLTRNGPPPSQRELADFASLEPIYVSKLARALEQQGLIVRTTNPADPRAVQLALTPKGEETVEPAIGIVADLLAELTAPIGGLRSAETRHFTHTLQLLLGETE
jgi:MarR family transcriptional regulator, organic hydroperoxide resistance regulator